MLIIQEKYLVSDDVVHQKFACQISKCKGACCWKGEAGAPLESDEVKLLEQIYPKLKPFLSPAGIDALEKQGRSMEFLDVDNGETFVGTPLVDSGPCAYMTLDGSGVASCGIEVAWEAGAVDFQKPISCHLYPIRVEKSKHGEVTMLNYDEWDICAAACQLGAEQQIAVYEFLREPLIRAFGVDFYEELAAAAAYLRNHP